MSKSKEEVAVEVLRDNFRKFVKKCCKNGWDEYDVIINLVYSCGMALFENERDLFNTIIRDIKHSEKIANLEHNEEPLH